MSHENIIRAWKDAEFRNSLSQEERGLLPEHPAGLVELTDIQLKGAAGGEPISLHPSGCPNSADCTEHQCTSRWLCFD